LRPDIELAGFIDAWSINSNGKEVARQQSGTVVGTTRGSVVAALYKEALATIEKGHKIEFHFGMRLKEFDASNRSLKFLNDTDEEVSIDTSNARLLDGTGCWSKIRDSLAAMDDTFVVEKWAWGQTFRNLFVDSADTGFDPKVHYIYSNVSGMYVACLGDNKWAFSIGCLDSQDAKEWFLDQEPSVEKIAKLKEHVGSMCPKVVELIPEDEWERFFSYRHFTGQVVKCSRLHHKEELAFFGDACHAVLPATGEGCNSALEDVKVLVEAYAEAKVSGRPWFETYHAMRVTDAHALSDYAHYLVSQSWVSQAEKNRRTANFITVAVVRKMGLYGPTWNELTFGEASKLCTPYHEAYETWERQSGKVRWLSDLFASIANRKLPAEEEDAVASASQTPAAKAAPAQSLPAENAQGA